MCSPIATKEAGKKQEASDISSNGHETDLGSEKGKGLDSHCNFIVKSPIPAAIEVSQTNSAMTNGHGNDDLSLRIGLPSGIAG